MRFAKSSAAEIPSSPAALVLPAATGPVLVVAALSILALLSGSSTTPIAAQEDSGPTTETTEAAAPSIVARDLPPITVETLREVEKLLGLEFTEAQREQLLEEQRFFHDVRALREGYGEIRGAELTQDHVPALHFRPGPLSWNPGAAPQRPEWSEPGEVRRPDRLEEVAYWPVGRLSELVRTRQVTSVELTEMYLERLRRHDPELHAVITFTEELALEQAARADREIRAGEWRGPLHGIPYGLKDLFAVEGYPTTWGAAPYRDQRMDGTATVARKLEEAGAVLVAKLSLGALAWGDVWFGERTRNPWNPAQGSSGSSAGSAAAVSAGLVPFAIGSETWGSLVSPATRTGVTTLRPTFGRVSRAGAMAVSWSMDKVGPLCRTVEDCALVFDEIRGADGIDHTVRELPFGYRPRSDLSGLTVGYLAPDFAEDYPGVEEDRATLEVLEELGATLVPVEYPDRPLEPLSLILGAEAAASFEELTLNGRDSELTRQETDAWPNVLRTARFIPAAEYVQANRIRARLGEDLAEVFREVDVYVAPSATGNNSLLTNLTGHPVVAVPNGFLDERAPKSTTFVGRLYDEATVLAVARTYQNATGWHTRHPERFVP